MIFPLDGGGNKIYASIVVIYPEGSICTCTNGTKTYTAKNTSGKWVFGLAGGGSIL